MTPAEAAGSSDTTASLQAFKLQVQLLRPDQGKEIKYACVYA